MRDDEVDRRASEMKQERALAEAAATAAKAHEEKTMAKSLLKFATVLTDEVTKKTRYPFAIEGVQEDRRKVLYYVLDPAGTTRKFEAGSVRSYGSLISIDLELHWSNGGGIGFASSVDAARIIAKALIDSMSHSVSLGYRIVSPPSSEAEKE